VVGEQGLKDELSLAGLEVVNCVKTSKSYIHTHEPTMSLDEFGSYEVDKDVQAVVAGVHYDFTYRTLCIASLYL
jgi:ribonucleotide monophosphatase NagD (HAD superfamily)